MTNGGKEEGWPAYCCAILYDSGCHQLLLEQRDASRPRAPGQLTCFGGQRERGEEPLGALLRECQEELQWQPRSPTRVCDLYVGHRLIAWFYLADAPEDRGVVVSEEGSEAVWLRVEDTLAHPKLSRWHREVLTAWQQGRSEVHLDT
eukprot:GGOE01044379.1.p1 GENE.GGOE01044379.1~~GGOE01044379.1.p1  ORF type:complete len:161 (-),score=27.66 GGOE01044379.1:269-709(-)